MSHRDRVISTQKKNPSYTVCMTTPLEVPAWQLELGEVDPAAIIDIRPPEAFRRGRLTGAVSLPYERFQVEIEGQIRAEDWVLIVDTAGARAAEMAIWLRTRGYAASSLEGGMTGWRGKLVTGAVD